MTLKIGMLGSGGIADEQLAPALGEVDEAVLWSVLSRDSERARGFAERHGARSPTPAYTDLDAMLADAQLDAVIIASPDKLHAAQAIAAARAAKHVLCEKPMATGIEEAKAMVEACAKARVKLGVAHHMRWHPGHRVLAHRAHAGEFGELRHMRVQWTWKAGDASNWRAAPDVGKWWSLGGVGTHCLDQIRWFMCPGCGEVEQLRSVISRALWGGPHDESAILSLRFESGATAELCSSVTFDGPRRMEVYGSEGYALCEDTLGASAGGSIRTDQGELAFEKRNPYAGEIRDFAVAVSEDRSPEVDGEEGVRNVELLVRAVEP